MRLTAAAITVLLALIAVACSAGGTKPTAAVIPSQTAATATLAATSPPATPTPAVAGIDLNSLSPEARKAAEVAIAPGHGYTAVVTSVSLESFRAVMCGRGFAVYDTPVWAVAIRITSRTPMPIPPGATVTPQPDTMLWLIDASTYVSLQTLSPWPVDRAPGSNCP